MGYSSQTGQVGFRTQTAKGTYNDPGAAPPAGQFMRTRSGALGVNRELLIPDAEIGGGRDVSDAYLGAVSFAGEYDFYVRLEAVATLLKGVFGASASATAGTGTAQVGTHTITPVDDQPIPWLSIEEAVSTFDVFRYTDAKVNTIHLEADANGYLTGTAGLIALSQIAGATKTATPDWDTTPMIVGTNIDVTWDGAALPARSFSFDATNNLEDDDFRLGSLFLGGLVEKRREVTAGVTIRPEDNTIWREAVYGSPVATTPLAGAAGKGQLRIVATTFEVIGTSSDVYSLDITIPKATVAPFALEPSGDDVMEHTVEIRALRPDPAVDIATIVVTNGLADVA